jgi:hypothetical protein
LDLESFRIPLLLIQFGLGTVLAALGIVRGLTGRTLVPVFGRVRNVRSLGWFNLYAGLAFVLMAATSLIPWPRVFPVPFLAGVITLIASIALIAFGYLRYGRRAIVSRLPS